MTTEFFVIPVQKDPHLTREGLHGQDLTGSDRAEGPGDLSGVKTMQSHAFGGGVGKSDRYFSAPGQSGLSASNRQNRSQQ